METYFKIVIGILTTLILLYVIPFPFHEVKHWLLPKYPRYIYRIKNQSDNHK